MILMNVEKLHLGRRRTLPNDGGYAACIRSPKSLAMLETSSVREALGIMKNSAPPREILASLDKNTRRRGTLAQSRS